MRSQNFVDNRFVFFLFGAIDDIVLINALNRAVGRNFDAAQPIDVAEFGFFGHGRAGHACQFGIKAEVVLERNGSQRLIFGLNGYMFLGFNRLMQTVGVTAAFHHTACKFIDNHDFVVLDDIVNVPDVHFMGAQSLIDVMNQRNVADVVQAAFLNQPNLL